MLYCEISYPGYFCFSSHLSGAYFIFFYEVFFWRLLTQGQLISIVINFFCWWFTILASILLALRSWYSPKTGTSQYACAYAPSYTGCGLVGEYHGGDASISPRSSIMSKNRTFRTASCLARYFVWPNAGQAESIWAVLSGAVPHSLQVGSLLLLL